MGVMSVRANNFRLFPVLTKWFENRGVPKGWKGRRCRLMLGDGLGGRKGGEKETGRYETISQILKTSKAWGEEDNKSEF